MGSIEDEHKETILVPVLSCVLSRLVSANKNVLPGSKESQERLVGAKFYAQQAPSISILEYLKRIWRYSSCSNTSIILALIYIDRLIQKTNFVLCDLNIHRVLITAVLLSSKFFDDQFYNNAYYAKVGGVLCREINSLEIEFLSLINFNLFVNPDDFGRYHQELENHITYGQCDCIVKCGLDQQSLLGPCEIFEIDRILDKRREEFESKNQMNSYEGDGIDFDDMDESYRADSKETNNNKSDDDNKKNVYRKDDHYRKLEKKRGNYDDDDDDDYDLNNGRYVESYSDGKTSSSRDNRGSNSSSRKNSQQRNYNANYSQRENNHNYNYSNINKSNQFDSNNDLWYNGNHQIYPNTMHQVPYNMNGYNPWNVNAIPNHFFPAPPTDYSMPQQDIY